MIENESLVRQAYAAFNRRDAAAALSTMRWDVSWADGEGGMLHGREAVRAHWTAQWNGADVTIEPQRFTSEANDRILVEVRMLIRKRDGSPATERTIKNRFSITDGLIERMDIPDA
jgi:hypothetical protein